MLLDKDSNFFPYTIKVSTCITFIQHCTEDSNHGNYAKIIKRTLCQYKPMKKIIQLRKEEEKLHLFTEDMILHKENPEHFTKTF